MFREFTYQWVLAEDPVLATEVEEITKPAEAFIQGWSGELARIMNLNTKDAMERLLLKAQEKKWSIDYPKLLETVVFGSMATVVGVLR